MTRIPLARLLIRIGLLLSVAESPLVRQDGGMKIRSWLARISSHLLGVVDEYWAMREPAQYSEQLPCCNLNTEVDATSPTSNC